MKIFLLFLTLFIIFSFPSFSEVKMLSKNEGSFSTIVLSEKKRALLLFDFEVIAKVGETYRTNINGLTFKVVEISPRSTRVYGVFNKTNFTRPDKLFVFGIFSLADLAIANQPAVEKKPEVEKKVEEVEEKPIDIGVKDLSYSLFYTFSFGNFDERISGTDFSAESTQNSYLTIGGSLNFKFHEKFSYSGSGYFSKLNSAISTNAQIDPDSKVADIPWEYGFTSYVEYSGFKYQIKPYVGFDFESFSTFNTDEVKKQDEEGTPLLFDVRTHSFLYGTFGVYTFTKILERPSIIKASISTNFTSSSSRPSTASDKDFNGQKFIIFVGANVFENWGASFMYKQHMMKGPTDLTISRFGFGVSYKFQ